LTFKKTFDTMNKQLEKRKQQDLIFEN